MSNIVAIVGRPNVGKSTLFNRLIGEREAIVDNQPGVTRDRHYGFGFWGAKHFTVIDTGGYVVGSDDVFEEAIRDQVLMAVEECTVVLFVVDTQDGITDLDKDFANVLRRSKKPVFLVTNKADNGLAVHLAGEFYALGMGDPWPVSAMSGSGTGDLLDAMIEHFPNPGDENPNEGVPRIAILGRPNVGKSSLVNALLGVDRNIVTDIAGTTRDAIDSHYKAYGKNFILTDTAGIRRTKALREDQVDFYATLRSIKALERSDVAIIILDATEPISAQDVKIIALANDQKKGIVLLYNKWDLVQKETMTSRKMELATRQKLAPMDFMPILFISVTEKQRIFQAIEAAIAVYERRQQRIATSVLNNAMLPEIENYPPPALKGKLINIKYVTQLKTHVPSFAFFCNLPQYIREPYARYLENKLREHFDFEGVPVNIFFRKK